MRKISIGNLFKKSESDKGKSKNKILIFSLILLLIAGIVYLGYPLVFPANTVKLTATPAKEVITLSSTVATTNIEIKPEVKEKTEFETLGREIAELEAEKRAIENALSSGQTAPDELQSLSLRIGEVIKLLDDKEMRWLELSEV